jgi:2-oxoglutarate ferredoxin oxidoreductase subunit beta
MKNNLPLQDYLREIEFPTIWCPGCGHGIVTKAAIRAIAKLGLDKNDVLAVSGIGCSARAPAYCDFNSVQTTHGRAIAFATGMKMHRPDLHALLFLGDGDCAAIGGNHFLHAAKRNIDLTVIVMNNNIYGMTGGQGSPTTPFMSNTTTTPFGNVEPELKLCEVAMAAGATFVARTTAYHVNQIAAFIERGLKNKGFSLIEVIDPCPTGFGRRNKFKTPVAMYEWLRDAAVSVEKAKNMSEEELEGRIITGVFKDITRPEYISEYEKMSERAQKQIKPADDYLEVIPDEIREALERYEIRLTGSGGQGLVLAGIMLAEATIKQGRNAVHSQSYGPEARGGASRSEVVLSDGDINFPEVIAPDVLLAMTQQAADKFSPGVKPEGIILLDSTFVAQAPEVDATKVFCYPITGFARERLGNPLVGNVLALGILARLTGKMSLAALESTVRARVPAGVVDLNVKALQEGYAIGEQLIAQSK